MGFQLVPTVEDGFKTLNLPLKSSRNYEAWLVKDGGKRRQVFKSLGLQFSLVFHRLPQSEYVSVVVVVVGGSVLCKIVSPIFVIRQKSSQIIYSLLSQEASKSYNVQF